MRSVLCSLGVFALTTGLFVGNAAAKVPPPPVNQDLGVLDVQFNDLAEANCRGCHTAGVPDRHHLNVGTALPVGECAKTVETCGADADCTFAGKCDGDKYGPGCATAPDCVRYDPGDCDLTSTPALCPDGVTECTADADCAVDLGPCVESNYCVGEGDAPNNTGDPAAYDCLDCHNMTWNGSAWVMDTFRDCRLCHNSQTQPLYPTRAQGPNKHHATDLASSGNCQGCHGSFVDLGYANAVQPVPWIPPYDPSLVTPWPSGKPNSGPNGEGNCNYCHNPGPGLCTANLCQDGLTACVDDFDCDPLPEAGFVILDNHDTHHDTGLTHGVHPVDAGACTANLCRDGVTACVDDSECPPLVDGCYACHDSNFVENGRQMSGQSIRTCEVCHGINSLHNIAVDSDGNGLTEPGVEPAGYSHIGDNADCNGCHGFTAASATAFFLAAVPSLDYIDCSTDSGTKTCTAYGTNLIDTETVWGVPIEAELATVNPDGTVSVHESVTTASTVTASFPAGAALSIDNMILVKLDPNGGIVMRSDLRTDVNAPVPTITAASCDAGTTVFDGSDLGLFQPVSGGENDPTTLLVCSREERVRGQLTTITEEAVIVAWDNAQITATTSECPDSCNVTTMWGVVAAEVSSGGNGNGNGNGNGKN